MDIYWKRRRGWALLAIAVACGVAGAALGWIWTMPLVAVVALLGLVDIGESTEASRG